PDAVGATLAAKQPAHSQAARLPRRLIAAASRPERGMRTLHWLWQHFATRDLVVGPVVGGFLLGPEARQHIGELLPHAARVLEVGAVGNQLIGIARPADPDID